MKAVNGSGKGGTASSVGKGTLKSGWIMKKKKTKLQRAVEIIEKYVAGCTYCRGKEIWVTGPWGQLAKAIAKELK